MMFRDLKIKPGKVHAVTLADVHMPVRLGHRDAKKLFQEPLKEMLAAAALGTVMGCMRRKRANGDVIGVDLYLGLRKPGRDTLETVAGMLESLAAPLGSSIRFSDAHGTPVLFGRTEGIELSVANAAAPTAAARKELAKLCRKALRDNGVNRGWAEANGRTSFFFYSDDFIMMKESIASILSEYPQFADASLRRLA